ncbi:hypothetical protein [Burkholderia thailandensis]|uniref:hypothetical protein n=1 Tax=Burkholderia thailandensis TaxID=57975 RepID=UPI00148EDD2C|nr:hypothetical protein [Burkholderia thailandensis]
MSSALAARRPPEFDAGYCSAENDVLAATRPTFHASDCRGFPAPFRPSSISPP